MAPFPVSYTLNGENVKILILNGMKMQGYCDVYKWTQADVARSKKVNPMLSRPEMCTLSVNDVNYHKFSHGTASYMLNGKTLTSY